MNNSQLSEIKVKVVEYNGELIIETLKPEQDENFTPSGNGRIGCVLINTGKYLGMSREAWNLIKTFHVSGDCIGDVMTWRCNDGRECFGWIGSVGRRIGPDAELSRDGAVDINFIEIPNELSPNVKDAIDKIDSGS